LIRLDAQAADAAALLTVGRCQNIYIDLPGALFFLGVLGGKLFFMIF